MTQHDQLHRYLFENYAVRGELVTVSETLEQILANHTYPQPVKTVLAELLVATSLLTATLKFAGDITVQLQGDGPLQLAVINGNNQQQLRGVQQCGGIGCFRTEGQRIAAQRRQQMYPRRGELLCRGAGVGRGQRNDDVGPCAQRGAHPDRFRQDGYTAPLHSAAAQTDSHAVGARCPDRRKLGCMAVVKGVIFGYDACKFHRKNLPTDC